MESIYDLRMCIPGGSNFGGFMQLSPLPRNEETAFFSCTLLGIQRHFGCLMPLLALQASLNSVPLVYAAGRRHFGVGIYLALLQADWAGESGDKCGQANHAMTAGPRLNFRDSCCVALALLRRCTPRLANKGLLPNWLHWKSAVIHVESNF